VTSDHGEEFGEHGERGHGHSLYREVLQLPAILHTSASSGGRIEAKLEARDFFDLILRVATDPALDAVAWGRERARTLRYASTDTTTPIAFYRPYLGRVFLRGLERDGSFLVWSAYGETHEVYDVDRDPGEHANLARARREEIAPLSAAMEQLFPHWVPRVALTPTDQSLEMLRALGYVE
jgi:arylsulfatase A-like enzyme